MKCGAIAPLFIHVVLLPWGNTLALCLSLEIFFEVVDLGGKKMPGEYIFSAVSIATISSARVTYNKNYTKLPLSIT